MQPWFKNACFYHIYPLGLCGCPGNNDFNSASVPRLERLNPWLDHMVDMGMNAVYLGPVFESTSHGYDTADYYHVDRRLGSNETLVNLSREMHNRGIRLVLDGVFNHVGRNFWAFSDVQKNLDASKYKDWFSNLEFGKVSPYNDPFSYEGWNGHSSLVKLNLKNPEVKDHLFNAAAMWIDTFNIDGIRLDTADCLDMQFMKELSSFCRSIKPDFWLMGEVIHGDYRSWVNPETLDSVTNYEVYKGLFSSHNDANFFEIAYSLNRQFGDGGMYADTLLYSFADNHDVNRVASELKEPAHLSTLYTILFTMPGIPSIYYGSEWGITGAKENGRDEPLRPELHLEDFRGTQADQSLLTTIKSLIQIRNESIALQTGKYKQMVLDHKQFAFARYTPDEAVLVCVNSSRDPIEISVDTPPFMGGFLRDMRDPKISFTVERGNCTIALDGYSGRILKFE